MNSSSPLPDSEDVLEIVFNMIRDKPVFSLTIAAAGLVIIVVSVAVISVFCDRKCHRSSRRAFALCEPEVTGVNDPLLVANQKSVEGARPKGADAAAVVENRQTGPSEGTVCSTVSELAKQPLGKEDGGISNDKRPCGGNTVTDKCLPDQSTPKDPISTKETPKDPISPKETPKDPISPKETPKDPISTNEAKGQDGATATGKDLGAVHQSAVDRESNRLEGEFNKVNDLNDIAMRTIEDSLDLIAATCFQNQKYDEDSKIHGQNGPPQFDSADTLV